MIAGSGILIGLALLQSTAPAARPNPAQTLTDRIEVGFRACAMQLTQRDYLTSANAVELKNVGITLGGQPPADVLAVADRLFATGPIYASVATTQGEIWIATSATVPACKVVVSNSDLSLTARYNWSTKLRSTTTWTFDKARSGMNGNFMRDVFVLNAERPDGHMITILDGPNIVLNEGAGTQMIMTVALDTAKAP